MSEIHTSHNLWSAILNLQKIMAQPEIIVSTPNIYKLTVRVDPSNEIRITKQTDAKQL